MYYPYLRGKQFELLAVREFSEQYAENCFVFPIIEPIRESFNSMKIALKKMNEKNLSYAIILNPQDGELIGKSEKILEELDELLSQDSKWMPAYIINTNSKEVQNEIRAKNFKLVMIICQDIVDKESEDFRLLVKMPEVCKVVFTNNNRSFKSELRELGKEIIRIDDKFRTQKRNSDYSDIIEEKFSEEVFYFDEEHFNGFSDYTVLPSTYIEGGMLPYALAIHLTYRKKEKEIWIRHFVSDTKDDNTQIHKKFGEAAKKAVEFFQKLNYSNNAINELTNYYNEAQYPGLGVLKKISIKSHIELMNSILQR